MAIVYDPDQYFSSRTLRLQAPYQEGRDVKILQSLLNLLPDCIVHTHLETDGVFGVDTRNAVSEFQNYFSLNAKGIVSDDTFYYLGHCQGKFSKGEPVFSSRIIHSSIRGRDVHILQNRLAAYKKTFLNRPASGKYDIYTSQAIDHIQNDFSIQGETGLVGPQTYDTLLLQSPLGGRVLKKGRHGLDTYFLQLYLYQLGYYHPNPDGFFNTVTFKALKDFQHAADIRVDGIAGPQTFLALGNSLSFPRNDFSYRSDTGDSISSTAGLFQRTEKDLLDLNGLTIRHKPLKSGQLLKIPGPCAFHLLKKGDHIDAVAEKYGISQENLVKANRLQISMGLVPGETLLLPGYQVNLTGCIVYLNRRERRVELKSIHLKDMKTRVLHVFHAHEISQMSIAPGRIKLNLSTMKDWHGTFNLNTNRLESLPLPCTPNGGDHLKTTSVINRLIIEGGRADINGPSERPCFCHDSCSTVSAELENVVKQFSDKHIRGCRLSPDASYILIFASTPPNRESTAYLGNIKTGEILKIDDNNFGGVFSTDSQQFLLTSKQYFGAYYPWFYIKISLFSSRGYLLSEEILTRSAEINEDCFNPDNTAMVLAMGTPNNFYPLPERSRHLYVKKLNSSLLIQITAEEKPFSPVWI